MWFKMVAFTSRFSHTNDHVVQNVYTGGKAGQAGGGSLAQMQKIHTWDMTWDQKAQSLPPTFPLNTQPHVVNMVILLKGKHGSDGGGGWGVSTVWQLVHIG